MVQTLTGNDSLNIFGRTENDIRQWITDFLREQQLDPDQLDAPAPDTLPAHPLDYEKTYGLADPAAFEELTRYFSNAAGTS